MPKETRRNSGRGKAQVVSVRALMIVFVALLTGTAVAQVKVPAIFGDHMVLQGGRKIHVWGTAEPGEQVVVILGSDHATTKADAKGNWRIDLKPLQASAATLTMTVAGKNILTFDDVLIGDVWVASGQSNMEFQLKGASNGAETIKNGTEPLIRLFIVPRSTSVMPMSDIGQVHSAQPFLGKWQVCSPESLTQNFSAVEYFFGRDIQKFTGLPVGLIDSAWGGTPAEAWTTYEGLQSTPQLAAYVERHKQLLDGYDAALTSYPQALEQEQAKHDEWLKTCKPKNDAAMAKWTIDNKAAVTAGKPEIPHPATVPEPQKPDLTGGPMQPAALFNGMIAPIVPYGIKGVIWYQGESNASRGFEYRYLFPAMIQSWRAKWGQGDFPFLYVQLPDFQSEWGYLRESQLKTLSLPNTGMAIAIDAGTLKNIHPPFKELIGDRLALVAEHVAYGKELDYSGPLYKSMQVEGNTVRIRFEHGEGLHIGKPPVNGPDTAEVPMDKLVTFTIAGADRQWQPADAKIDGDTVIVSAPEVKGPVAVRFGWNPPSTCNLYNKAGLPASPFRTDDGQ